MIYEEAITALRAKLLSASDPITKEKVLRLTSGANCIGVAVPKIRETAKAIKKEYALSFSDACAILDALCPEKCREEILLCIFVMASFPQKQIDITWARIGQWLPYIDNWETCDQLSSNIATILIHRDASSFDHLLQYAGSPNLWIRRFAAATAANANHGGHSYPEQTRAICEKLKNEKEPMVKKAITWALHELEKSNI